MADRGVAGDDRWAAHPVLGGALRVAVVAVPMLVGLAAGIALARLLPTAQTLPGRIGWYAAVLGGSFAALLLTDRLARRALPLAVLLELSLVFPDRAPSRLRAARTPSVREIEKKMLALRRDGISSEPIETAETLVTLVGILGVHDKKTRGHSERVRAFTDLLTGELRLAESDRMRLRWAALVHDLGKLVVPGRILNGGRDLSDEDWATIRRHPEEGQRLAAGLLPWLGEWGSAVVGHHERWDGSGYPAGTSGAEIGYGARIVAVADAFEVMTSARSYHRPRSAAAAREELTRCAGAQFDPQVVRAFLGISVGRLRWVLGPVTWLAQLPFAAAVDRAGQAAKGTATAAAVGGLVLVGVVPGPGAADRDPPAVVATTRAQAGTGPQAAGPLVPGTTVPGGQTTVPAPVGPPIAPDALPFVDEQAQGAPAVGPTVPAAPRPAAPRPAGPAPRRPATPAQGPVAPAPAPAAPVAPRPVNPGPVVPPPQGPVVPAQPPLPPVAQPPVTPPTPGPVVPPRGPVQQPRPSPPGRPASLPPDRPPTAPPGRPPVVPPPPVVPSPVPSPTLSPPPAALGELFLASGGVLRPDGPLGAPGTVRLAVGASTSYDVLLPVRTQLSGKPRLVLHTLVEGSGDKGEGHARLLATVSDCAASCTVLSTGHVEVKAHHHDEAVQVDVGKLKRVGAVVEAGHVLRLTVALDRHGKATSVLVLDGAATPSRLVLSGEPAPEGAPPALGLAVVVLLGGLAARPKQRQVGRGVDVARGTGVVAGHGQHPVGVRAQPGPRAHVTDR